MTALRLDRLDGSDAAAGRDTVAAIYEASYCEAIVSGDPFDSVDAFMARFDHYVQLPGFDMVMGSLDTKPIGQTWGWPLRSSAATTGWWSGLLAEPEPDFRREDGHRTFALSEIMVVRDHVGRGFAHRLHNELLLPRTEERATLLVEPDNQRARRAYLTWGWHPVAQLRPRWDDAPLFDVLVRPLPVS